VVKFASAKVVRESFSLREKVAREARRMRGIEHMICAPPHPTRLRRATLSRWEREDASFARRRRRFMNLEQLFVGLRDARKAWTRRHALDICTDLLAFGN